MRGGCLSVAIFALVVVGCTARKGTPAVDAKAPAPATAHGGAAPAPTRAPAPKTEEGCRACSGKWGIHGIEQTPTCLCRTHDVGRRCRGKDECEGDCLGDAGEREVTQPGPPPLGFWVGRCSEFHATFGCHVFLQARAGEPVRLDVPAEQLCAD
jgi:hypothetical protein